MPLYCSSQLDEHNQVWLDAGMFDVSHMTIVDLAGGRTPIIFCATCWPNDVAKLAVPGKALYTSMLNASGGLIDDLIAYFFSETKFCLVVNFSTRDKDVEWIIRHAEHLQVVVTMLDDLSLIAVQGTQA